MMIIMLLTWYQRLSACPVYPLLIDFINLWLTLAISFHGNFHTRREETSL